MASRDSSVSIYVLTASLRIADLRTNANDVVYLNPVKTIKHDDQIL